MIFLKNYFVSTTNGVDVIEIVSDVRFAIHDSKIPNGFALVSLPSAEAVLQIAAQNKKEALKETGKNFPFGQTSVAIPFEKTELKLDPKQTLFLIDTGDSGKRREFFVQIFGEAPQQQQQTQQGQRRTRR